MQVEGPKVVFIGTEAEKTLGAQGFEEYARDQVRKWYGMYLDEEHQELLVSLLVTDRDLISMITPYPISYWFAAKFLKEHWNLFGEDRMIWLDPMACAGMDSFAVQYAGLEQKKNVICIMQDIDPLKIDFVQKVLTSEKCNKDLHGALKVQDVSHFTDEKFVVPAADVMYLDLPWPGGVQWKQKHFLEQPHMITGSGGNTELMEFVRKMFAKVKQLKVVVCKVGKLSLETQILRNNQIFEPDLENKIKEMKKEGYRCQIYRPKPDNMVDSKGKVLDYETNGMIRYVAIFRKKLTQ